MKNKIYLLTFFIVISIGTTLSQIKYDFTINSFSETDSSYVLSCTIKNNGDDFTYIKPSGEDILFYSMEVCFINSDDTLYLEQPDSSFILYDIECLGFSNESSIYLYKGDSFTRKIAFCKSTYKELNLIGCYEVHLFLYFKDYPHCDPKLVKELNVINTDIHAMMFKCF